MKVALLISGEFREFAIAHKFWPFLQWDDIDIYFSTWSTSTIIHANCHKEIEPINYKLINSLKPKGICVEIPKKDIQHNALKMIHRLKEGFNLILNSGINYDVVMTIRPDVITFAKEDLFREEIKRAHKEQTCLIDCYGGLHASGDAIIIYPIKYVREFYEYDFSVHVDFSNPVWPKIDIHRIFGKFFYGKADSIKDFVYKHTIVRVNARSLSPLHQKSFRQIAFKTKEWWEQRFNTKSSLPDVYDPDCT